MRAAVEATRWGCLLSKSGQIPHKPAGIKEIKVNKEINSIFLHVIPYRKGKVLNIKLTSRLLWPPSASSDLTREGTPARSSDPWGS